MINLIRSLFGRSPAQLQRKLFDAKSKAMEAIEALRRNLLELETDFEFPNESSVNPKARHDLREQYIELIIANSGGDLRPILQDYGEAVVLLETARKRRRFSIATRQRVWDRCGRTCAYCAEAITSWTGHHMHLDHVVPFSKGGTDDESNLVAACPDCNGEKSDDEYDDDVIDAIL